MRRRTSPSPTGNRAGAEVAQLYLTGPAAAGESPYQLKGFQKVPLAPRAQRDSIRLVVTGGARVSCESCWTYQLTLGA